MCYKGIVTVVVSFLDLWCGTKWSMWRIWL